MSKLPSGSEDPPPQSQWHAHEPFSPMLLSHPCHSTNQASWLSLLKSERIIALSLPLARPFAQAFSSLSLVHLHHHHLQYSQNISLVQGLEYKICTGIIFSFKWVLGGIQIWLFLDYYISLKNWPLLPWIYQTGMLRRLQGPDCILISELLLVLRLNFQTLFCSLKLLSCKKENVLSEMLIN